MDDGFLLTINFVKHETAAAFCCEIDGEEVWIPKSQIIDGEPEIGDEDIEVTVTSWLASQEGWT